MIADTLQLTVKAAEGLRAAVEAYEAAMSTTDHDQRQAALDHAINQSQRAEDLLHQAIGRLQATKENT